MTRDTWGTMPLSVRLADSLVSQREVPELINMLRGLGWRYRHSALVAN